MHNGIIRAAFVVEQTLGHVTHTQNLRTVVDAQRAIAATWLPISFEVNGTDRFVPILRSNWSVRASWHARLALTRALSREPHDALFFHTQVTSLFSAALMERYPSVISLDATPIGYDQMGDAYHHRPAGDGFLDRRKYDLNRRAFRAARALLVWSSWARNSLVNDYGVDATKIKVLAPGASAAYFEIGERRAQLNEQRDPDAPVRILFVGSDFVRKGGPALLEAISTDLGHPIELHVVTQQPIESRPNVVPHRAGPNSPELLRLFEMADLFVLPSQGDCLALVLMEATAAGLPVITTAVGALAEAVRDGESGLVIRPGDADALRQALRVVVSDPEVRRRMGNSGALLAREKFDARRNNQELLHTIAEVAHGVQTSQAVA